MQSCVCVFYHALYENVDSFLYVCFVCLYTIDLYKGICTLHVFLWVTKCFESEMLPKFPIVIIIICTVVCLI